MVGLAVLLLPGSALQAACWGFPLYFFPSSCQVTSGLLLGCIYWVWFWVKVWRVEKVLWLLQFKLAALGYCFLFICLAFLGQRLFSSFVGLSAQWHRNTKYRHRFAQSNSNSSFCMWSDGLRKKKFFTPKYEWEVQIWGVGWGCRARNLP